MDSWHRQSLLSGTTQDAGFISANTAERRWLRGNLSPLSQQTHKQEFFPDCCRACVSRAVEKAAFFFLRCPLTFHLTWKELREHRYECSVSGGSSHSCTARAPKHGCLSASAVVRLLPSLIGGCNSSITCEM